MDSDQYLKINNKFSAGVDKEYYSINGGYYNTLDPNDDTPILLDYENNKALKKYNIQNLYERYIRAINNYGTICPTGNICDTPGNISLDLKLHQKRTLYELLKRESNKFRHVDGLNYNLLSDEVGSGKSLCILSLIAHSPLTNFGSDKFYSLYPKGSISRHYYGFGYEKPTSVGAGLNAISLKTNLIIVPHNIFSQWKMYIQKYTKLANICIGRKKDYEQFCNNKKSIIDTCNNHDIILIKSTMFKNFYNKLLLHLGRAYIDNEEVHDNDSSEFDIVGEEKILKTIYLKTKKDIYEITNTRQIPSVREHMKKNIKKDIEKIIGRLNNIVSEENWKKVGIKKTIKKCTRINLFKGFYFERVIIDEVDSIKIPAFPFVNAKQIWHITSSINNIFYPYGKTKWNIKKNKSITISTGIRGTGFLKDVIVNIFKSSRYHRTIGCYHNLYNIVRNNKGFVQSSIELSKPEINYIECFTPNHILAVSHAVDKEVLSAFNAGDFTLATKLLGCNESSEKDIITNITNSLVNKQQLLENKIENKKKLLIESDKKKFQIESELNNSQLLEPNNLDKINEIKALLQKQKNYTQSVKSSIANFTNQLTDTINKISGIKSRVSGVKEKLCPICCCNVIQPALTPCCNNVFCIECITKCLQISKKKTCPLCRKVISFSSLQIISENKKKLENKSNSRLDTKLEKLCKILKKNITKRFIIFSEFEGGIVNIKELFEKESINYMELKGSEYRIKNITEKFQNRDINILLLNAKYSGAGLNLQYTDEIILFHRMSKDLESQVIGRAQRIGRTSKLAVNYLCYSNELPKKTLSNIVNTVSV